MEGIIEEESGTFKDYLVKDSKFNTKVTDEKHGKLSVLDYRVMKRDYKKNRTLVKINLKTGKTSPNKSTVCIKRTCTMWRYKIWKYKRKYSFMCK